LQAKRNDRVLTDQPIPLFCNEQLKLHKKKDNKKTQLETNKRIKIRFMDFKTYRELELEQGLTSFQQERFEDENNFQQVSRVPTMWDPTIKVWRETKKLSTTTM